MNKQEARTRHAVEERFLEQLKQAFADNLYGVILYGSYVQGSFVPGVSDVNVLILTEEVAPQQLQSLSRAAHRLIRRHRITPLILSRREFERSADVYPMEYLDIADRHRVLYGSDATEQVSFSKANLRHELEHQLRGTLISLRQLLIASRGSSRRLGSNLKRWYGQMGALFRGLLRLAEVDEVPLNPSSLVSKVNEVYGLESGPFQRLIEYRSGTKHDPHAIAREVVTRLATLVQIVDTTDPVRGEGGRKQS